jgi:hypothetical protein
MKHDKLVGNWNSATNEKKKLLLQEIARDFAHEFPRMEGHEFASFVTECAPRSEEGVDDYVRGARDALLEIAREFRKVAQAHGDWNHLRDIAIECHWKDMLEMLHAPRRFATQELAFRLKLEDKAVEHILDQMRMYFLVESQQDKDGYRTHIIAPRGEELLKELHDEEAKAARILEVSPPKPYQPKK